MRNLSFLLLLSLLFFSCGKTDKSEVAKSEDVTIRNDGLVTLSSANQEIEYRAVGDDDCIVKGDCSALFCHATIECGCDETPKCECSWSSCRCDCEKKGSHNYVNPKKYSVDIYQEYIDNLNSLKDLSNSSSYLENRQIAPIIEDVLISIENDDIHEYGVTAEHLYDFVHSIQSEDGKAEINDWFASRNIPDEL